MKQFEDRLSALLFRATCPDTSELGDYYLDLISSKRRASVAQHLSECTHCTRELTQLDSYMTEVSPDLEYSLGDRIKIWIARLIPEEKVNGPVGTPAYALRGGDSAPLLYEAGEAQLMLEIRPEPDYEGQYSVAGLLIGTDVSGMRATLWQGGGPVDAIDVDDLGNFIIGQVPAGSYELILVGSTAEIHVQELTV